MKSFFFKVKSWLVVGLIFILISSVYSGIVASCVANYNGITIVIDAGHGGRDGGSVGVNGTIEKEINLVYANALKDKLVSEGYRVEMTRKNDDGLYSNLATNKKKSDMNERMRIIKKANPNLVLSIHMNSFADSSVSGASTFYRKGDESGKLCAEYIQGSLNKNCNQRSLKSKVGDYYLLNCSYYTAVLIECGFLTNPDEERLLNTEEHKNKIVEAIYHGVLLYFG